MNKYTIAFTEQVSKQDEIALKILVTGSKSVKSVKSLI